MKDQGGAVYIFMNENGSFQETATVILKGSSASGFGFAVAAIGDVNQDGFQGINTRDAEAAPSFIRNSYYISKQICQQETIIDDTAVYEF